MNDLWRHEKLCDVVIPVDSGELRAHKIALGAYSDSLSAKFAEFPQGEVMCIDLSDFKRDIVYTLLHFLYTTELHITQTNVGPLLVCANELGIAIIAHMCRSYLGNFNIDTALIFYAIADSHNFDDIRDRIYGFLCERFSDIVVSSQFLFVPYDKVLSLLSSESLSATELQVFQAVARWVSHKKNERMPYSLSLLKCVRFYLISPEDLANKVETVHFIFEPRENFNILYDAFK